jgi:hypothetical protein
MDGGAESARAIAVCNAFAGSPFVELPFTSDQFFGVFAEYNRSFWLVALTLWLVSVVALAGAWRTRAGGAAP